MKGERQQLLDKIEKLEASKARVEKIMKQTLGSKSSKKPGESEDLMDELNVILRRIEFLEDQSEERQKQSFMEHGPCKRELQRLEQELIEERNDKQRLL